VTRTCAIALLALVGTAAAADKTYPEITHDQLVAALANRTATLLDANGTASYKEGHIPGALDFAAVKTRLATVLPRDKAALVVCYCADEDCPDYREAAEAAEELGYTNIKHYAPGISGWKDSGARIEIVN
jgi:rhodanese-related sulfurtransferase